MAFSECTDICWGLEGFKVFITKPKYFCFSFLEVVSSSPHSQLESDAMYQKV